MSSSIAEYPQYQTCTGAETCVFAQDLCAIKRTLRALQSYVCFYRQYSTQKVVSTGSSLSSQDNAFHILLEKVARSSSPQLFYPCGCQPSQHPRHSNFFLADWLSAGAATFPVDGSGAEDYSSDRCHLQWLRLNTRTKIPANPLLIVGFSTRNYRA